MANYGEMKIKAQKSRAEIVSKMAAYVAKEADGEALSPEDATSFGELKKQVDEHDERICRLEDMEKAAIDNAEPVSADVDDEDTMASGKSFTRGVTKSFNINTSNSIRVARTEKDTAASRFVVGSALAKMYGIDTAKSVVDKAWGDNAVTKSLSLTTATPIIPQDFALSLIPLLTAKSVVRQFATTMQMSEGNRTIPRQRLGSVAAYLNEGAQIPVSSAGFDNIQLNFHKYGAFTYTTKEMLYFSPLDASTIITNDLVNKAGLLEDVAFLTGNGSNYPVTGIIAATNSANVFTNTTVSGAVNFQTVSADLQTAELNLTGNFVTGNFVWVMSPYVKGFLKQLSSSFGVYPFKAELDNNMLNGFPVYTTRQLGTNLGTSGANLTDIILVNADDCIIGDAYRWAVSMSTEGSFVDGSTQVNAFGQDLVAFKLTNAHDFALKHDVSASILQASAWSLGNTAAGKAEYDQTADTQGSGASSAED